MPYFEFVVGSLKNILFPSRMHINWHCVGLFAGVAKYKVNYPTEKVTIMRDVSRGQVLKHIYPKDNQTTPYSL